MDLNLFLKGNAHFDEIQEMYDWVVGGQCEALVYYLDEIYSLEPADGKLVVYDLRFSEDVIVAEFDDFVQFLQGFVLDDKSILERWSEIDWQCD